MTPSSATMNRSRSDELVHPFKWHVPQSALEDLRSRLARTRWPDDLHWSQFDRGGHFATLDAPDLLVGDLRAFFRPLR